MSDNDKVICPNCVNEFVAVPVNVQSKLAKLEEDIAAVRAELLKIAALNPTDIFRFHEVWRWWDGKSWS